MTASPALSYVYHLELALEAWAARDNAAIGGGPPGVRQAANVAMESIDGLLAELHRIRAELVTQMREFDDASMARADALLGQAKPL